MITENLKHNRVLGDKLSIPFPSRVSERNLKIWRGVVLYREVSKEGRLGAQYDACIQEMLGRGVVRKVSKEEMDSFDGVVNYLPHLPAFNLKCKSTPI